MNKNYPINMTIPGIHFKLVSDKFTSFQKNRRTHFLENHKITDGGQADRQTDGLTLI